MPPAPSTSTPQPRTLHNMTCSATDAGRRCRRQSAAGSAYCDLHAPLTDAAELLAAYFSDDMSDDEESFVPFFMVGGTPETALEALRQWKAHPPASPPPALGLRPPGADEEDEQDTAETTHTPGTEQRTADQD
jgi:hypothetical protein